VLFGVNRCVSIGGFQPNINGIDFARRAARLPDVSISTRLKPQPIGRAFDFPSALPAFS
jgi:hypothetical protein